MATTESSVVVALREVRRLELERQRREEETRIRAADEERQREEAAHRASIQYGQGLAPQGWNGSDAAPESYVQPMRRTSEVVPVAPGGHANGFHEPQPYIHVPGPTTWEAPPQVQQRSGGAFKAVVATLLVCAGGAAFGYWKLTEEHKYLLGRATQQQEMAETARNEAVAAQSKTEQTLKLRITELERKLETAAAKAGAASVALAQATAVANASMSSPAKPGPLAAKPGGRAAALKGRAARLAAFRARAAAAAKPEPAPLAPAKSPKVAKKKAVSDDPLGGLRL